MSMGGGILDAAIHGDAQAVAAWLDGGGSVDAGCAERNDATLLMVAALGGQEAVVRMLLQRGASVNLQSSLGLTIGVTALMRAALNGHTTIVQALLDAKADASLQATNGRTALMLAEHYKQTATAQLLRQHAKRQAAEAEARAAVQRAERAARERARAAKRSSPPRRRRRRTWRPPRRDARTASRRGRWR